MPDESELREVFRDVDGPDARIDLDAVLRRARARRRPRAVLAIAVGALAITGIAVPVGLALTVPDRGASFATAEGAGPADAQAPQDPGAAAIAGESSRCGAAVPPPSETAPETAPGLSIEIAPVDAAATASSIPVTLTVRNSGTTAVRGVLSAPELTLARDRLVLWHSPGIAASGTSIDLAPGDSIEIAAAFEPSVCAPIDDAEGFRAELPAAGPGDYLLSARLVLTAEAGADPVVISAPASPVVLR